VLLCRRTLRDDWSGTAQTPAWAACSIQVCLAQKQTVTGPSVRLQLPQWLRCKTRWLSVAEGGGGRGGTIGLRSQCQESAAGERRPEAWCRARAETAAGSGDQVLARAKGAALRPNTLRARHQQRAMGLRRGSDPDWRSRQRQPGVHCGTRSPRRTKALIIYEATGNLKAVQILFGQSRIESTVLNLGLHVGDAPTLAKPADV
jgi:hypothetical protein